MQRMMGRQGGRRREEGREKKEDERRLGKVALTLLPHTICAYSPLAAALEVLPKYSARRGVNERPSAKRKSETGTH